MNNKFKNRGEVTSFMPHQSTRTVANPSHREVVSHASGKRHTAQELGLRDLARLYPKEKINDNI